MKDCKDAVWPAPSVLFPNAVKTLSRMPQSGLHASSGFICLFPLIISLLKGSRIENLNFNIQNSKSHVNKFLYIF